MKDLITEPPGRKPLCWNFTFCCGEGSPQSSRCAWPPFCLDTSSWPRPLICQGFWSSWCLRISANTGDMRMAQQRQIREASEHRNVSHCCRSGPVGMEGVTALAQSLSRAELGSGSGTTLKAQESCPRLKGDKEPQSSHGYLGTGCSPRAAAAHGGAGFTESGDSIVWLLPILTCALPQPCVPGQHLGHARC